MKTRGILSSMRNVIAWIVLVSFVVSPYGGTMYGVPRTETPAQGQWSVNDIQLPENLAHIGERIQGRNKPLFIHIKDLHCVFEVQEKIAQIIRELYRKYGLDLVLVEGASGKVDIDFWGRFPIEQARSEVLKTFVREGYVTGPESVSYTHLTLPTN